MKSLSLFFCAFLACADPNVEFKTKRVEQEFTELKLKNPQLYEIITEAGLFTVNQYGKKLVITEIYRTQEEQNRYYKNKPKFISPHQRWLAVDLRSWNFTPKQVKTIVDFINTKYNKKSRYIPTAFYHNVGLGPHIHVQFKERYD